MIYLAEYIGGPKDGETFTTPMRPYDTISMTGSTRMPIYVSQHESQDEWVDDDTRKVKLQFVKMGTIQEWCDLSDQLYRARKQES